jgi:hypothetical protein
MNMRKAVMLLQLLILSSAHGAAPADQTRCNRMKGICGALCMVAGFTEIAGVSYYAATQNKSTPPPIEPDQLIIPGQKCGGIRVQSRDCPPSEFCTTVINLAPTCSVFNLSSEIIDSCPFAPRWSFWESSCMVFPQINCFSDKLTQQLISAACKTVQPTVEIKSISHEQLEMRNNTLFNTTKMVGKTPHEKFKIRRKQLRENRISKK